MYLHSECNNIRLSMGAAPQLAATDGRLARSERARAAVAGAFLDLLNEGDLRPSAGRVARRAGFSPRLVFHHFSDLESLFAAAADLQTARLSRLVRPIPAGLELTERVGRFVAQRARLMEAISPVRRAAVLQEPFSAEIARRLDGPRRLARVETGRVFEAEIDSFPNRERRELLAALDAASSWPVWDTLRRHQKLSVTESRQVMERTFRSLLSAGRAPHRRREITHSNGGKRA